MTAGELNRLRGIAGYARGGGAVSNLRTPFSYWRDWMHPVRTVTEHRQARSYERAMTGGLTTEEVLAVHRKRAADAPHVVRAPRRDEKS